MRSLVEGLEMAIGRHFPFALCDQKRHEYQNIIYKCTYIKAFLYVPPTIDTFNRDLFLPNRVRKSLFFHRK